MIGGAEMKAIDTHAHVFFIPDMYDYEHNGQSHPFPMFEYMDRHNIEYCSCVACSEIQNEETVKEVQNNPRLFGIGYIDVHNMYHSLNNFYKYSKEGIFRGTKMHPYIKGFKLDSPEVYPIYDACMELDIPALFHTGFTAYGTHGFDPPGKESILKYSQHGFVADFANVLEQYPDLKIIFAHGGGNWYREYLGLCERFPNAYFDLSWLRHYLDRMLPAVTIHEWIEHMVKILGPHRILWAGEGSLPEDVLECKGLTDTQKEDILWNNAYALFKLGDKKG